MAPVRSTLWQQRARLTVAGLAGAYFALLLSLGGHARWTRLGVPNDARWFDDLRNVTSAWECTRRGIPVLPTNPCDPDGARPANYPRLWLLPSHLGLGQGDTFALGWAVLALFLVAAVLVVPTGARVWTGVLHALALCSAAAMLGVERGNVDLALFALVVAAVLVAQGGARRLAASGALVLLAAALKLFPIFAVGFVLRRGTRAALAVAAAVVLAFAAYLAAIHRELAQILAALPQPDSYAFGLRRLSEWIGAATGDERHAALVGWDVLVAALVAAVAAGLARARRRGPAGATAQRDLDFFFAGACVYAGSYVAGRNYDYRLVFLLLCVPQLARWLGARSALAAVAVAGLLGAMWLDGYYDSATVRGWLDAWSRWTAAGAAAQPLPLAVVAQALLFASLACLAALSARRPLRT